MRKILFQILGIVFVSFLFLIFIMKLLDLSAEAGNQAITEFEVLTVLDDADSFVVVDDDEGDTKLKQITWSNLQLDIVKVGTIATGAWDGTDIPATAGGTGASTLTDGGILLGSGTGAITPLGVATNGQIPIGDGATDPVLATITGTADEITVTNGAGTITIDIPDPFIVGKGGSGAATFTDGGVLLGAGTGAFTALGAAANGQIPIGDGTTDPVLAGITGTANEVTVTDGAGTITLSLPNHAGTDISADLEEEVTEGSLANDTILEADLKIVDAAADEDILTRETTTGDFEWHTCAEITGSADLCDGGDASGASGKEYWWPASATLPLERADLISPISKNTGGNIDTLDVSFDDSTEECRTVTFKTPFDMSTSGTVTLRTVWYSKTATSGNVRWDFRHNSGTAQGATWDTTLLTISKIDAAQGSVNQFTVSKWQETASNLSWATDDNILAVFCRKGNIGADNMVGDAELFGCGVLLP